MDSFEVIAGSRLHFGLICAPPDSAWHYGGIGLMVDRPGWRFRVSKSETDSIVASDAISNRVRDVLATIRTRHAIPTVSITACSEVGPHTGLGSGTQLALAIGSALLLLAGVPRPVSSPQLAAMLNRNRRSGIGTRGFDRGGFIVDRGRSAPADDSLQRISFPDDWRLVLLTPKQKEGLSGKSEESFFGKQPFLPKLTVLQLEQLIEHRIIPSLEQQDFRTFATAIAEYGRLAGEYYATEQGGIFSNPLLSDIAKSLAEQGVSGAAQSSWGPTVSIPAESHESAESIVEAVTLMDNRQEIEAVISRPLNIGATIRSTASEDQRSLG